MVNYNFTGFSAPTLDILFRVCLDMEEWLSKDYENTAVVHCFVCELFLFYYFVMGWEGSGFPFSISYHDNPYSLSKGGNSISCLEC